MKIKIIKESGYDEAILGLSLSKGTSIERAKEVAKILCSKDGGHNKLLESIYIWLDVTAPRYWWQEADTYRLSTKQSESTMYTIQKNFLTQEDFQSPINGETLLWINYLIHKYNRSKNTEDLVRLKNELPEGFLQRRIWVMSYKTLRNIILQRISHRLPLWKEFCSYITQNVEHSELLPKGE
jgi:hypothetical protein